VLSVGLPGSRDIFIVAILRFVHVALQQGHLGMRVNLTSNGDKGRVNETKNDSAAGPARAEQHVPL